MYIIKLFVRWRSFSGQLAYVKITKLFERKIVIIFLPIDFNMFCGCSKEPRIETVLLSIHNICFG